MGTPLITSSHGHWKNFCPRREEHLYSNGTLVFKKAISGYVFF
jgi:hypothetical protein